MAVAWRSTSPSTTTATAGTTAVSLTLPTGATTGDVLVAFVVDHSTSNAYPTAPTGWQQAGLAFASGTRFSCFTAVIGQNGVSATGPWSFSGLTTRAAGVVLAYSGGSTNYAGQPDVTSSVRVNASGTTGTLAITPGNDGDMVIAAFCAFASGSTWSVEAVATGPALTEHADGANSTYCSIAVADGVLATKASTGNSSATMGTAGTNAAILLSIKAKQTPVQTLTETAVITDALTKGNTQLLTETVTATDALTKGNSQLLSETTTITDSVSKLPSKLLTETTTFSDVVSAFRAFVKTLSEVVVVSDALAKRVAKTNTETAAITDVVLKGVVSNLSETTVIADVVLKGPSKSVSEVFTLSDSISRALAAVRTLSEAITLTDDVSNASGVPAKQLVQTLEETLLLLDELNKSPSKTFSDVAFITDTLTETLAIVRVITDTLEITDGLEKQANKTLVDSIDVTDSVFFGTIKGLYETVTFSDVFGRVWEAVVTLAESVRIIDAVTKLRKSAGVAVRRVVGWLGGW